LLIFRFSKCSFYLFAEVGGVKRPAAVVAAPGYISLVNLPAGQALILRPGGVIVQQKRPCRIDVPAVLLYRICALGRQNESPSFLTPAYKSSNPVVAVL